MTQDHGGDFTTSLRPLPGGASGETFLAGAGEETTVLRVYAGRSAARGPLAPEVDAAVLRLVRGVLPVPEVLEVRRGDPEADLPGLLVVGRLPGEPLVGVLPGLDDAGLRQVGEGLGVLAGRLGLAVQPRRGLFADQRLVPDAPLPGLHELLDTAAAGLPAGLADALRPLLDEADGLLAGESRSVLVHGDLNPRNVLVDPGSLEVTGLVDWEFAHAGGPWEDLGNLLRHAPSGPLRDGVLASYASLVPGLPDREDELVARARAADLAALVDLAGRSGDTGPGRLALRVLAAAAGWTLDTGGA